MKTEITSTTLINAEIAELVARLSADDAALLFVGLGLDGAINLTPVFAENMDRLRNELLWAPLLKFYETRNKHLVEELETYLDNLGWDDGRGYLLNLQPQTQDDGEDDDNRP